MKRITIIKKLISEFVLRYKEELILSGVLYKEGIDAQLAYLNLCNTYLTQGNTTNAFRLINYIDFKEITKAAVTDKKIDTMYFEFEKNIAKLLAIQTIRTQLVSELKKTGGELH